MTTFIKTTSSILAILLITAASLIFNFLTAQKSAEAACSAQLTCNTTTLDSLRLDNTLDHLADNLFFINSDGGLQLRINSDNDGVGTGNFQINNSANNTVFTVQNDGKVGIGTASPFAKLEVNAGSGGTPAIIMSYADYFGVRDSIGNVKPLLTGRWTNDAAYLQGGEGGLYLRTTWGSNTIDVMYLSNSGNVGIGTANPGAKLEVVGQVKITGGTPGAGKVLTSDASGLASWQTPAASGLGGSGDANYISKFTAASTLGNSTIYDNGNVGIGTVGPNSLLHVYQTSGNNAEIDIQSVSGAGNHWGIYQDRGTQDLRFWNANVSGGNALTIKKDGNVGIGTTNPQAKLVVSNAGAAGVEIDPTGGTGGGGYISAYNRSVEAYIDFTTYAQSQHFWVSGLGAEAMTILTGGNVGIGTTNPGAKLDIYTGNGTSGLKTSLVCSNANTSKLYTDASGNVVCGTDQTGGGSGNIVDTISATLGAGNDAGGFNMVNLGKVGIGTTNPQQPLTVIKSVANNYVANIQNTNTAAGTSYGLAVSGGTNNSDRALNVYNAAQSASLFTVLGNGNVGIGVGAVNVPVNTLDVKGTMAVGWYAGVNTAPSDSLIVAGNVGIGTTNPGAKLEVAGQVKITGGTPSAGKVLTSDAAGLASWQTPAASGLGGSGTAKYIPIFTGSGATVGNSNIYQDSNKVYISVGGGNTEIGSNQSDQLTIIGKVGIGTANPGYKLDVQGGAINASGGLCLNGDCKTAWSQVGGTSERIVEKITRLTSTYCSTPYDDIHQCTREEALSNSTDVYTYGSVTCHPVRIECSMEYTKDSGNSIQIEINDPSDTNWECADYNLQDYCGDEDGCRGVYYGQAKQNYQDQVAVIPFQIFMEQPGWSRNNGVGVFGWTRQDGADYGWVNGDGTGDNLMNPWSWTYLQNYYWSGCGGDNTAFSNPYIFRFASHPQIHSKYIIYDNP